MSDWCESDKMMEWPEEWREEKRERNDSSIEWKRRLKDSDWVMDYDSPLPQQMIGGEGRREMRRGRKGEGEGGRAVVTKDSSPIPTFFGSSEVVEWSEKCAQMKIWWRIREKEGGIKDKSKIFPSISFWYFLGKHFFVSPSTSVQGRLWE